MRLADYQNEVMHWVVHFIQLHVRCQKHLAHVRQLEDAPANEYQHIDTFYSPHILYKMRQVKSEGFIVPLHHIKLVLTAFF